MLKGERLRHEFDVVAEEAHSSLIVMEPKVRVDLTKQIEAHRFTFDAVFNEVDGNESPYHAAFKAANAQHGPGVSSQDRLDSLAAGHDGAATAAAWHGGDDVTWDGQGGDLENYEVVGHPDHVMDQSGIARSVTRTRGEAHHQAPSMAPRNGM